MICLNEKLCYQLFDSEANSGNSSHTAVVLNEGLGGKKKLNRMQPPIAFILPRCGYSYISCTHSTAIFCKIVFQRVFVENAAYSGGLYIATSIC